MLSFLPKKKDWLIRVQNKVAYVWKRKFILGMIPIPWALHGGTKTIFTPDTGKDVVVRAMTYINEQQYNANITVEWTEE